MNLLIYAITFLLTTASAFSHATCCKSKQQKWALNGSVSGTNTSSNYTPTNHHQGLSLDHSTLSVKGPASKYLIATGSIAIHTSKNRDTKKTKLDFELEDLSLQTTNEVHQNIETQIGRFASHISTANQTHCCGAYFIKRPLLYRGFLGGHLIENGAHFGYKTATKSYQNSLGIEIFQGNGLMPKSNKNVGLMALMAKHERNLQKNHKVTLSGSYILNTLYNQNRTHVSNQVSCCQGSSYTGNHMLMANLEIDSSLANNIDHNLSLEAARINKLATRFGKNNHHFAYNTGSVTSFKNLKIGTIEVGLRFDYLRGIEFCSCEGVHLNKTVEKTAMLGWKPSNNQTVRFEYTKQTIKNSPKNNIFQTKYTLKF